jgi:hypothetical protein
VERGKGREGATGQRVGGRGKAEEQREIAGGEGEEERAREGRRETMVRGQRGA